MKFLEVVATRVSTSLRRIQTVEDVVSSELMQFEGVKYHSNFACELASFWSQYCVSVGENWMNLFTSWKGL